MRWPTVAWVLVLGCGDESRVYEQPPDVDPAPVMTEAPNQDPFEPAPGAVPPPDIDSPATSSPGLRSAVEYYLGQDPGWGIGGTALGGVIEGNSWQYLSARAEQTGAGLQIRIYREPIVPDTEFVPRQHYVELTVPVVTPERMPYGAGDAKLMICSDPGVAECLMASTRPVTPEAGAVFFVEQDASGALYGGATLSSGASRVDGVFGPVSVYPQVCTQRSQVRCTGGQLERCVWDRSSWFPLVTCADEASCLVAAESCAGGACIAQAPSCP